MANFKGLKVKIMKEIFVTEKGLSKNNNLISFIIQGFKRKESIFGFWTFLFLVVHV